MLKNLKVIFTGLVFILAFVGCANQADDAVNPGNTEETEGIVVQVAEKGAEYSKDVGIDLSETPLSDDTVKTLTPGSDVSEWFNQNTLTAGRAVLSNKEGLEGFKVTVKEISATKLVVTFTAKTPKYDCAVYVSVTIPAEKTKDNVPVSKVVEKVAVGEGVKEEAEATVTMTIPKFDELAGKRFPSSNHENETEIKLDDKNNLMINTMNAGSEFVKYFYDEETGLLKPDEAVWHKAREGRMFARKINGKICLLYAGYANDNTPYIEKLERKSGNGIYSVFELSEERELIGKNGEVYDKGSRTMTFTFNKDFSWSGTQNSYRYYDGTKNDDSNFNDDRIYETTELSNMTGFFTGENGVITVKYNGYNKKITNVIAGTGSSEPNRLKIYKDALVYCFYDGDYLYFGGMEASE